MQEHQAARCAVQLRKLMRFPCSIFVFASIRNGPRRIRATISIPKFSKTPRAHATLSAARLEMKHNHDHHYPQRTQPRSMPLTPSAGGRRRTWDGQRLLPLPFKFPAAALHHARRLLRLPSHCSLPLSPCLSPRSSRMSRRTAIRC